MNPGSVIPKTKLSARTTATTKLKLKWKWIIKHVLINDHFHRCFDDGDLILFFGFSSSLFIYGMIICFFFLVFSVFCFTLHLARFIMFKWWCALKQNYFLFWIGLIFLFRHNMLNSLGWMISSALGSSALNVLCFRKLKVIVNT